MRHRKYSSITYIYSKSYSASIKISFSSWFFCRYSNHSHYRH